MLLKVEERRSPLTHRKSTVYILKCDACEAFIEASACRLKRHPHRHFCDTKCMGRHKREHPEAWPNNGAARNTPEACAKAEATRQRKIVEGTYVRSWKGRHHSEKTKQRLSELRIEKGLARGENNGMFGRKHSEETRAKMSEAKARAIAEGRLPLHGTRNKKGHYVSTKTHKEHFFRSSWEEAVMKFLDTNPTVEAWEYESVRIPYVYGAENRQRWYVPDFVIYFSNGTKEIWEVKPQEFLLTERVMNTTAAGREYCQANGFLDYRHITKEVMKDLGIL